MIYKTQKGQVIAGEAIGILLLDSPVPFIPVDVANATQLTDDLLNVVGVSDSSNLVIGGLQDKRNFHEFAIEES